MKITSLFDPILDLKSPYLVLLFVHKPHSWKEKEKEFA